MMFEIFIILLGLAMTLVSFMMLTIGFEFKPSDVATEDCSWRQPL